QDGTWDRVSFAFIRPKIGGKSTELLVSNHNPTSRKRGWKCGEVTLEFSPKYSNIEQRAIDDFISSIDSIFSDGLLEVLQAIYSPYPVIISGDPGEGKSVRMKQIASAMSTDPTITQVPLFIKAKDLVRHLGEWANPTRWNELNFDEQAVILGKSFCNSNQDTLEMAGISEKEVTQSILDIYKNSPDSADAGLVLLIDAIDEIDDKRKIDYLLDWVIDFKDWFGGGFARTILSTRPSEQARIETKFNTRNAVKMNFEDAALAKTFPQALVKAWSVPDSVAEEIEELFQQQDVLKNIDRPLLIGWLCRFVHDELELGDLTKSYGFYEKILDLSTEYTRFEQERGVDKFSPVERESIQRMRNCVAFLDLIGTLWENDTEFLGLNSHESRMKCLSLRKHQNMFPGLKSMTDDVAHQLFFEDMSLLYVTGGGGLGWTHEFLREYAAALFWTELTSSKHKTLTNFITKNAVLFGDDVNLNSVLEQHVFPYRRYFKQAVNEIQPSSNPTKADESGGTERSKVVQLNKSEYKLRQIRNQIAHGRDVHPEEFAEMLTENFSDDIRINDVNSESFKVILNYFYEQDVNWVLGRTGNQNDDTSKTYLELITGGVIPTLAEKLLTEDERNQIFNNLFRDSIFEKKEFDFEKIKAYTFEKFINSSKKYDLTQYQKILTLDFQQKDIILDDRNLNLDIATLNKLQDYIDSYTNNDAPKALFRKFYEAARPDVGGRKEKALRKLLDIEQENGDEEAEQDILEQLFKILWKEKRHAESKNICEEILAREDLGDTHLKAYCLTILAALEKRSGAYEQSEKYIRKAMEIEKKIGLRDNEAGSLMFLAKLAHQRGMPDKASFFLGESELILNELVEGDQKARSLYLLGNTHIETESYDEAERVYGQCLQINRNLSNHNHVAACLNGLGLAAFYKDDHTNALDYYAQSLRLNQEIGNQLEEVVMLRRIGNIHRLDGNVMHARDNLTKAIDLALELNYDEETARIYKLLGHLDRNEERYLYSEDNYEESFSLYKKLGDDNEISLVAYHLGQVKYRLKKYKESEKFLQISYDLDKAHGALEWQNASAVALAKAMRMQKRYEGAETLLQECIDAHISDGLEKHTFVNLILQMGHTLRLQRKFGEAESQYQNALQIGIEMAKQSDLEKESDDVLSDAYYYLGWVNQNLGNLAEARDLLGKGLIISKKNEWEGVEWACQNRLGSVERALGEFSQAETHYKRCLEIDREEGDLDSQVIICTRLGLVADEIGNHFKSENWYREAYTISLSTEDLKYQSITLCRIGEAQNLRGDYAEAEVTLEKCIEVDQQRKDEKAQRSIAITFEGLGQAKLGLGKYAEAREMYQKSLEIAELLNDDVLLSSLHNRLGKLEEAEKNVTKALHHMQLSKLHFDTINQPLWDRASQYSQRTIQRLKEEHHVLVFDEETQTVIERTDLRDDPTDEKHHRNEP
ncbi:MAG TPA: hypothetical protein DGB85_03375, partial [Deltaproteobacteria bacterium]|nr:hypothetical protein [Deltaproteobacteria bacterium]